MATNKRARQRANRATKMAAEVKQARRDKAFKRIRRFVIFGVIFALVLLLANQIWGGGDGQALGFALGA